MLSNVCLKPCGEMRNIFTYSLSTRGGFRGSWHAKSVNYNTWHNSWNALSNSSMDRKWNCNRFDHWIITVNFHFIRSRMISAGISFPPTAVELQSVQLHHIHWVVLSNIIYPGIVDRTQTASQAFIRVHLTCWNTNSTKHSDSLFASMLCSLFSISVSKLTGHPDNSRSRVSAVNLNIVI